MMLVVIAEKITTHKCPQVILVLCATFVDVVMYIAVRLKGAEIK